MACKIISLSVQLPAVQCRLYDSYSSNKNFPRALFFTRGVSDNVGGSENLNDGVKV